MPSVSTFHTALEGTLISQISASATTISVRIKQLNGGTPTWLTGAHRVTVLESSRTEDKVEVMAISSATQSGTTATLTIGTRGLPLDGTGFSGTGEPQVFLSGARVIISWDAQAGRQTAFKDIANTFTATQTVSAPLIVSGTSSYIKIPSMTEAQRDALPASDGLSVYVTDGTNANRIHTYEGGAWGVSSSTTVADMSTTVAGKGELATIAEHATGAATGGTGSPLVVPNSSLVKTSSGASDENKIPVLNADGALHINHIATGTPDGTKFVRDDGVLAVPASTSTDYFRVYKSTTNLLASKDAVGNTVSETAFTTTYSIPANFFLAQGDGMLINLFGYTQSKPTGAGTITIKVKFGSTIIATLMDGVTMTDNTEQPWNSELKLVCATQGASGKLYVSSRTRYEGASTKDYHTHAYDSNNSSLGISFDTTAGATLTVTCQFSVTSLQNYCVLDWMNVNKLSSTAF